MIILTDDTSFWIKSDNNKLLRIMREILLDLGYIENNYSHMNNNHKYIVLHTPIFYYYDFIPFYGHEISFLEFIKKIS